jgi:AcrR family transcriptional regulator
MPRRPNAVAAPAPKATRRSRGVPRQLLLDSARTLFATQDYRSTTTREIAEHADVLEHLLFRNFGSKAALFREAVVAPFIELVDSFEQRWPSLSPETSVEEVIGGQFLGSMYDLMVANRGLIMTLLTADALTEEELAETGLKEIGRSLGVLGRLGAEGIDRLELRSRHHELAARSSVAMVMGMAAFGRTLFGARPPSRKAIVDELTQMTLHGFLHRS